MKKKLAVFACAIALMLTFTVVCFAEGESSGSGDVMWDLWGLLNLDLDGIISILGTLLTTVITFFKIIGGGSGIVENLKHAISVFLEFLK
ncbi:MAG: hypothetical protein ACI4I5_03380 [Acutalibacteraceae bacterium]